MVNLPSWSEDFDLQSQISDLELKDDQSLTPKKVHHVWLIIDIEDVH